MRCAACLCTAPVAALLTPPPRAGVGNLPAMVRAPAANGSTTTSSSGYELPARLKPAESTSAYWAAFAYFMTFFTVAIIASAVALRDKLRIAIAVLKEASTAVQAMPLIVFFPMFATLAIIVLVIYFVYVATLVSSADSIEVHVSKTLAGARA